MSESRQRERLRRFQVDRANDETSVEMADPLDVSMDIREWLRERADDEFFTFNKNDFEEDCNEILQGYEKLDDPIKESANREKKWHLLQAWQRDTEYISSLNLHRVIAKHVRNRCRDANSDQNIESWVRLDNTGLDGLAEEIAQIIRNAWKVRAEPSRPDPKFSGEMSFDSLDYFHLGLENFIGYPPTDSDFIEAMKLEHEQGEKFDDRNGWTIDPKVEWNIVMRSPELNILGAKCEPSFEIKKRNCTKSLKFYTQMAKQIFANACSAGANLDVLNEAEVAALRLWTGPMYKKYAEMLLNPQKPSPYVTTLHAINSGITKLARYWRLPASRKVYVGYNNLRLKDLKKDAFDCVGGVEKRFLSASEDFNVALRYSGDGGAFILEIDVGQVNRGADICWLSQFPTEREILFNALSNIEFVGSPQRRFVADRGAILVYQVCLSANVRSKTLEGFVRLRKDLHLNLVDILTQEVRRTISLREEGSRHLLIKNLGIECREQCNIVFKKGIEADIKIFNNSTSEYLGLVEAAIKLQSQSLEIIDLALFWFEKREADPAKLDRLQDWQLCALKKAFESSERPHIETIVLKQHHNVDNLFRASSLNFGATLQLDTACSVAKLLSLNPELVSLNMEADLNSAELWEKFFNEFRAFPGRANLHINSFHLAGFAISSLQQLILSNSCARIAAMIAPALLLHPPCALTSLNLHGSPIACAGCESLGRAFHHMQRLRFVDLSSCYIADRGCSGISQNLCSLTELECLNLAHNIVSDNGFNALVPPINTLQLARLKTVDLRCNRIQLPSKQCGIQCAMKNNLVSKMSDDLPACYTAPITCVAWSPDGAKIVSGSHDKVIIIWDAKTHKKVLTLKGHVNRVQVVSWSPDGELIASGSHDSVIIIWDANEGQKRFTLKAHSAAVLCLAWSPNGDHIVSGSGNTVGGRDQNEIIIWTSDTGDHLSIIKRHRAAVTSVSWNPGGDHFASGSCDKLIYIWDMKSCHVPVKTLKGHTSWVRSVAWSSKGDRIASGSSDHSIIIWNAITWKQISILKGHASIMCVQWDRLGVRIASGSYDKRIIVWDTKTGEQISTLKGHSECVNSVAWSANGEQIVSGSDDKSVIIWDITTATREQDSILKGHSDCVQSVTWNPNGNLIASGSDDRKIIIWDVLESKRISTIEGDVVHRVRSVAWSPNGDQIVSGGYGPGQFDGDDSWMNPGQVIIWDSNTGEEMSSLGGHCAAVNCVAWSASGDYIASGSDDVTIIVWDTSTKQKILTFEEHTGSVNSLMWNPHDYQIASASDDKTIITWEAKTGELLRTFEGHTESVNSVVWSSASNKIASGSHDKTIIIWDARTGKQVSTLIGHSDCVRSVVWSPNGHKIASGSDDKTVMIWEAKTQPEEQWELVSILNWDAAQVQGVAWSPNGKQLACGIKDQTIITWTNQEVTQWKGHHTTIFKIARSPSPNRCQVLAGSDGNTNMVWESLIGQPLPTHEGHTGTIKSVAWSSSGEEVASAWNDNTVIVWKAHTGALVSQLVGHSDIVQCVVWSASDDQVVSGSRDKTVMVWASKSGELRWKLIGHAEAVTSLACNSDAYIASGSSDGIVIVWDCKSGGEIKTLVGHAGFEVEDIAWSPSGEKIVAEFSDQSFVVWDAKSWAQISKLPMHAEDVESVARNQYEPCDAFDFLDPMQFVSTRGMQPWQGSSIAENS